MPPREAASPTVNPGSHSHVCADSHDLPDAVPSANSGTHFLHAVANRHGHAKARTPIHAGHDTEGASPPADDTGPRRPALPCRQPLADRFAHPFADHCAHLIDRRAHPSFDRGAHHPGADARRSCADTDRATPGNAGALTHSGCRARRGRLRTCSACPAKRHPDPVPIHDLLSGGNPRTLHNVDEVIRTVLAQPERVDELIRCVLDADDDIVRMRAGDALERVCRAQTSLLQPHVFLLLGDMAKIR